MSNTVNDLFLELVDEFCTPIMNIIGQNPNIEMVIYDHFKKVLDKKIEKLIKELER